MAYCFFCLLESIIASTVIQLCFNYIQPLLCLIIISRYYVHPDDLLDFLYTCAHLCYLESCLYYLWQKLCQDVWNQIIRIHHSE